ncbi:MAG: 30S ribosome-binding factor RbfA [Gemmatimonadota bacterium]|jgi:ribosome-binding factor A|nr:30S ribosome-binding factor RbfA [Gemmatimonadota bacterium]
MDGRLRETIAQILSVRVEDPRLRFVTVLSVEVSPEFDTARVFVSILGDETAREEAMQGLRGAAGFIQAELGRTVRIRRTPRLTFIYDDSIVRGMRMDGILESLVSDGPTPGDGEPEEEDRDDA